ncbi:hypothetical protein IW261DRAFT_1591970 [Armillaria novae-zelandiae]|uniref:F-box domain-containing protein n=1 Tax=Armillaria novae-zelandiae TaxID=153914 RepID=A0AA39PGU2_9AGAR|nr:hypothetical protein IW261DRAFT_1591970 [Armillaria novae-zelandiae]
MTSYAEETVHASPAFDNLLYTNDPPSSSEERELQGRILAGEARVVVIDNHIAALKELQALSTQLALIGAELQELDGERRKVVAHIAEHKRLLSPVRRLPPEILYEIFLGTIIFPMPEAQPHRDGYSWDFCLQVGGNALWSFELVCKTWHRAVLGFPELWSNINISLIDENFSSSNLRYVRQLACQVARSRCRPLSIRICAGSDQTSSKSLPPQLCVFLFSIQDQIQSLCLYLPAAMFTFVATLQLFLPILRNLTLLSTNGEDFQKLSRAKLFGDTPLLNSLHTVDIRSVVSAIDLPYHQITRYSTYHVFHRYCNPGPATSDILGVLAKLENLEECDLRCELRSTQLEEVIPRTCPKLQTLTLSSWAYVYPRSVLAQLLDNLVIPRVSALKVECCVDEGHKRDTEKTFTAIWGIIRRSQSPLTIFHFTHGSIYETDLLGFFRSASSTLREVKLLDVGPIALTDGILAPLVISDADADNVLLPRLHTLHISGKMEFDANLFVEMVVSRWTCELRSFQRLRTIQLCRVFDSNNKDREIGEISRALVLTKLEKYSTEGLVFSYRIL